MLESDVYRRLNLTTKVGPGAVKVNITLFTKYALRKMAAVDYHFLT